jgi:GNAT superfamily N-acetyltransferase
MDIVSHSAEHSLRFGVYEEGGEQVGFARVVTDFSTFAWLCDVFVLAPYRGKELGKWLVQTVVEHPDLQGVKRILLGTRDAHTLYAAFGFEVSLANAVDGASDGPMSREDEEWRETLRLRPT